MDENQIAKVIVDVAYHMHVKLGPGLLESVYQEIMVYELRKRGMSVQPKHPVPIVWDDLEFDKGFEADLVVNGMVVVELKSVESIHPVHKKQLLTYVKLSDRRLGLLINFGDKLIKNGISRVVNGLRD
ncbi:hypothetical protein Enr13x_05730 [Stieleria neptunia]|uniref:GxxExxY protein n=1 Tax=Stieleria neptunia TaxID=2527979 RepID=A0A518HIQ7_9BACT|nr:GxxExxY protein [Stieleria neptunia]QDV40737.1 hypothetical protein Enr13x_05730 [Stieleria neptunia]